jgi:hypothetical protein
MTVMASNCAARGGGVTVYCAIRSYYSAVTIAIYSTSLSISDVVANNGIINNAKTTNYRYSPDITSAAIAYVTSDNTIGNYRATVVITVDSGADIAGYYAIINFRFAIVTVNTTIQSVGNGKASEDRIGIFGVIEKESTGLLLAVDNTIIGA